MKKRRLYVRNKIRKMEQYGMHRYFECPFCGSNLVYQYYRYDADCCFSCDRWLEPACDDPDCPYCANRPVTPTGALALERTDTDAGRRKHWRRLHYQHKTKGKIRHEYRKQLYRILKDKEDL